jgi:hypothetical protein
MKFFVSFTSAVFALTIGPIVANAQTMPVSSPTGAADAPWLKDRRYTEGAGYRIGNLELHPGLAGEFGYDSNYFLRSNDDNPGPAAALHLKITPSLSVSTLSGQRKELTPGAPPPDFTFRGGINATYHELFPLSGDPASRQALHDARNVGGELDLTLGIRPGQTWSGTVYGSIARIIMPSEQGVTGNFNRDVPAGGAELVFTPGGGLLDWRVGYNFIGTLFEQQTQLTSLNHEFTTRGRWRFLPRTAIVYDGRFGIITYPTSASVTDTGTAAFGNVGAKTGSHPVRTRIGINGLITPSFGLMAMVGWGASFYVPKGQQNFDSVIGQAEVKYYITPNPSTNPGAATLSLSSVALGFTRDFTDSYIGTYYESDRGYLNLSYFLSGQFLLVAEGGAAAIRYPDITLPVVHAAWTDTRIDASLFGEYRVKDSLGINLTFRYDGNLSSTFLRTPAVAATPTSPGTPGNDDFLSYNRFQVYLGLRWFL